MKEISSKDAAFTVHIEGREAVELEAEMKTLKEVHDMLVMTGYKAEAIAVAEAIKQLEQQCTPFK